MKSKNRVIIITLLILSALAISGCATTILQDEGEYSVRIYNPLIIPLRDEADLAIKGYDTVAYFTQGKAIPGSPDFSEIWNDSIWYFSSENNGILFKENPAKYAPQYGSYCSWSVANNNYVPPATGDPKAWIVVDEKLYLTYNKQVLGLWKMDLKKNIIRSVEQWPIKVDLMGRYSIVERAGIR